MISRISFLMIALWLFLFNDLSAQLVFKFKPNTENQTLLIKLTDGDSLNVDWGDGQTDICLESYNHYYEIADSVYTITASGKLNKLDFNEDDRKQITEVLEWKDLGLTDITAAFKSTPDRYFSYDPNISLLVKVPNYLPKNVRSLKELFYNCQYFNDPAVSEWDVSTITDVSDIFNNARAFNQPIGNWDVSNVTDMSDMFHNAFAFNRPIGNWDVSNVTDMSGMFYNALAFNQPIGNWDVSNVTDMSGMFKITKQIYRYDCMCSPYYFNQPIGNWDVSNVTDMSEMFYNAIQFNQPIGNWDVSKVTDMSGMFKSTEYVRVDDWFYGYPINIKSNFNQNINSWDVSNVSNFAGMFEQCKFNQPLNDWDVSNATNFSQMFTHSHFNQPLSDWDVSNATNFSQMFAHSRYNQPLSDWDVSNATNFSQMFAHSHFNQPLNDWDVSNATIFSQMFAHSHFNQPLNDWDVSNATIFSQMFADSHFNQPLDKWVFKNEVDIRAMFSGSHFNQKLSKWDFSKLNFSLLTIMRYNESYYDYYYYGVFSGSRMSPQHLTDFFERVYLSGRHYTQVGIYGLYLRPATFFITEIEKRSDDPVFDINGSVSDDIVILPMEDVLNIETQISSVVRLNIAANDSISTYEIEFSKYPNFKTIVFDTSFTVSADQIIDNTFATIRFEDFPQDEYYYWRARPIHDFGWWSDSRLIITGDDVVIDDGGDDDGGDDDGGGDDGGDDTVTLPKELKLSQNYPNPFTASTVISFSLYKHSTVKLEIYNLLGEKVDVLVDEDLPMGVYEYRFEPTNYSSGTYFYRLLANDKTVVKKMTYIGQ